MTAAVLAIGGLGVAFLLVRLAPPRARLPLWCAVIVIGVAPWWSFQPHTHWDRIQWTPFVPPPDLSARDVLVNLILYVPFGLFAGERRRPWRLGLVVAAAAALSVATEFTQVYSHGRFPATTDVLLNAAGAAVGAFVARRLSPR